MTVFEVGDKAVWLRQGQPLVVDVLQVDGKRVLVRPRGWLTSLWVTPENEASFILDRLKAKRRS